MAAALLTGDLLSLRQQQAAEPLTLVARRHRHVLDQEAVGFLNRLDQSGEEAVGEEEVEAVLSNGGLVVSRHRLGLATDHGHPLLVGLACEFANCDGVGCVRLT